jgi:hypothetical protein
LGRPQDLTLPVLEAIRASNDAAMKGYGEMFQVNNRALRVAAGLVLGGLSLSACATKGYVDEQIATVNQHLSAVDAKATDAGQKADAAMSAAQAAQSAANAAQATAQSAQAGAQQANQRLDQLTSRVDSIEQRLQARKPRN